MFEAASHFFPEISIYHLNILFLLGLALFGGTIGGRLFQKLRIPQVVGYIVIGIMLGQSGLKIVDHHLIEALRPFNYFALGLIGLMIGGELKKDIILKYGKQFLIILLSEGVVAFAVVSVATGLVGSLFFPNPAMAWAVGLILGAIASATAPAATSAVLWEYRTQGPLTRIIMGIVAMDDGLALLLFSLASAVAVRLVGGDYNQSLLITILHPFYEILGSILIGSVAGYILTRLIRRSQDEYRILAFSIGMVLLVLGLSILLNVDLILASMFLGLTVVNLTPRKSKEVFELVDRFAPPIYVLFFVLVGAKLNFSQINLTIIIICVVYIVARTLGKMFGANLGARISGAVESVRKYLPYCLFSQAGVAIGLSLLADQRFPGAMGNAIVIIITTATFVLEIIGPPFVKMAVSKANEIGLNITEEDIIRETPISEIIDNKQAVIPEDLTLSEVLKIISETEDLFYPVVSVKRDLLGIITIDNIKDTFISSDLGPLLLAHDLMEPVQRSITPDNSVADVKAIMNRYGLEYLPVVTKENKLVGLLENRRIQRIITQKMIELRKHAEALG